MERTLELFKIQDELKNIKQDSTIIITSYKKKSSFELKETGLNEYTLYISNCVDSINGLFANNKKIKSIIFNNWNSSNIETTIETFASLELDSISDFSKQDFSNLKNTMTMFQNTSIKQDFYFTNHTLNNLQFATCMFDSFKSDNLTVDFGDTLLEEMYNSFFGVISNNIIIKIDSTNNAILTHCFSGVNCDNLILSDFNVSKCNTLNNCLENAIVRNKLFMPNTNPKINKKGLGGFSDNINKIYCNEEWSEILKYAIEYIPEYIG